VDEVGTSAECAEHFLRSLYARYYRSLFSYVLRMVRGDRGVAEDVVQETLLRAWQHADVLDSKRAAPWLYTVAHNIVISQYYRRRENTLETAADADKLPVIDPELDRVLDSVVIAEALRALTVDHRTVLVELFYRRKSVAEAADALHLPLGTVKSRSFYALRALRDALQERGVHP
jgi:RNA polymerase sigma-70 factor, ECF subfamily